MIFLRFVIGYFVVLLFLRVFVEIFIGICFLVILLGNVLFITDLIEDLFTVFKYSFPVLSGKVRRSFRNLRSLIVCAVFLCCGSIFYRKVIYQARVFCRLWSI